MRRIGAIAHTLLIAVLSLIGVAFVCDGAWLITVGGSWYYLAAGLAFVATAVLVVRRSPSALALCAALVIGTLAWAIWEAGLDWWPLAARGHLVLLTGILLLLPLRQNPTSLSAGARQSDPSAIVPERVARVA